ncbi:MAG TPA: glycosyltransferase family A protein, partial [Chloroflexota bacterium]
MDGKLGANLRGDAPSLVSICIPAYNAGHVLGLALSSILAQTWPSLEIILIDDGSTDDTSEVVRSVVDTRVVAVRNEKNRGGYQTMNQAVSLARGDFVAIYHADDVYEPTIVEKEASYLQSHPEVGAV